MLDFFLNVQQPSGGGGGAGGGGDAFNADGNPPTTPTHLFLQPAGGLSVTGFMIWDVSNPASPTLAKNANVGTSTYSVYEPSVNKRTLCSKAGVVYTYVDFGAKIFAWDVSNPTVFAVSNQKIGEIASVTSDLLVAAHPTKDILWTVSSTGKIRTIDISNPASMSVILEVTSTTTAPNAATMSFDGEYIFLSKGSTQVRYELNASNEPSNETTFSNSIGGSASNESIAYTEGVSGAKYLLFTAGISNILALAELDSSYNITSVWYSSGAALHDDSRMAIGMPYGSNYTSDDISIFQFESDDQSINIFTSNPATLNSFTHQVETIDGTWISLNPSMFDIYDQYIFVLYGGGQRLSVFEWSALNTLTRIAGVDPSGITNYCGKALLFAP